MKELLIGDIRPFVRSAKNTHQIINHILSMPTMTIF